MTNEKSSPSIGDSIFHRSPIAMVHYDSKGYLIDCNEACLRIFGIKDKRQVMGFNLFKDPNLTVAQKKEIKKGKNLRYELDFNFEVIKNKNLYETSKCGTYYFDCFVSPLKDDESKIKAYLLSVIDITEQKNAEKAHKESETKLKELNAAKDKMFSIIAHDLRSSFNTILGFSKILIETGFDNDPVKSGDFLSIIHDSAKNTLTLLENLLNWANTQTGQLTFHSEKILLAEVFHEIIDLLHASAQLKNVTLQLMPLEDITVRADRNMLKIILQNLITNAIKFSYPRSAIKIFANPKQTHAEIIIADSGVGMSEETMNKLFCLHSNQTTLGTANEKGSGLGLILCRELIAKQGGDFQITSEPGKGSNFIFTLPLQRELQAKHTSSRT